MIRFNKAFAAAALLFVMPTVASALGISIVNVTGTGSTTSLQNGDQITFDLRLQNPTNLGLAGLEAIQSHQHRVAPRELDFGGLAGVEVGARTRFEEYGFDPTVARPRWPSAQGSPAVGGQPLTEAHSQPARARSAPGGSPAQARCAATRPAA